MIFSGSDIEALSRKEFDCPNVRKAISLLHRLVEAVNAQSDGWAYWLAPKKGANKLMSALSDAGINPYVDRQDASITSKQLKDGTAAIRRMATTQKKKQEEYGNTFDFDTNG